MKETNTFASSNGINTIRYYLFHPREEEKSGQRPKAIVQISHGMCEFLERYEDFAQYLNHRGILVCGNDHLGHGASVSSPEDYGYFGPENGWICLMEDLHRLTEIVKQRYPGIPYFLLGHSMGSFVVRAYLSKYAQELSGAIIVGTSGTNPALPAAFPLTKAMIYKKGGRYRSRLINDLSFGTYNVKFRPHRTEYDWLSRDAAQVDIYRADPRCTFIFTLQGFWDLFSMLHFISRKEWAASVPVDLPIALLSGSMDPVGQYGKGVKQVHDRLAFAGVKDLIIRLYSGCRHEIINELNRETVYRDIAQWIEKRIV